MSNTVKSITATLVVVALSFWLWNTLHNRHTDIMHKDPELEIEAQNFLSALYDEHKTRIDNLYMERILEVTGRVKEVNFNNQRVTVLLKGKTNDPPYIICDMQYNQKELVVRLRPNDTVKIKGIFKGYLKDAVFLDCVITYNSKHE